MPHIEVDPATPGIVSLLQRYPDSARALSDLAETLLRAESPLTPGERELIAAYVSSLNRCRFCTGSHAAAARVLLDGPTVDGVLADPDGAPLDGRMRALLALAARVQEGGRGRTGAEVAAARASGASDRAIHDTVLVAAAFCMYNRYVDALDTVTPDDPDAYARIGERLALHGYLS